MTGTDAFQVVMLGIGTGLGTSLGVEMAKFLVSTLKKRGAAGND